MKKLITISKNTIAFANCDKIRQTSSNLKIAIKFQNLKHILNKPKHNLEDIIMGGVDADGNYIMEEVYE